MIITPQQLTFLRDAIFALVGLVLIFGVSYLIYHSGARSVQMADTREVSKQEIHDAEVNASATIIAQKAIEQFRTQVAAPPAADAPHLRLCHPASAADVQAVHGTTGSHHDSTEGSTMVAGADIGPSLDKRLADSDARVRALQAYIQGCIDAGRCAPIAH